jgi:transposase
MADQDKERWTKLVADFESTELTQREFASERGISFSNLRNWLGTPKHLELRQTASKLAMSEFKAWLDAEQGRHLPKGPMGEAINYALGQWDALTFFLTDPRLPVDNNASERTLRVAAIGRKNFLFVGSDHAGENLAGLYSIIATCEANGVNPVAYLADVLLRVQTHPASRLDEQLPHNWRPTPGPSS